MKIVKLLSINITTDMIVANFLVLNVSFGYFLADNEENLTSPLTHFRLLGIKLCVKPV